jgi:hypothetical protein
LEYGNGLITLVDVNHHNWSNDAYACFRFLGTEGVITGTIGLLYDYPRGRVDTPLYQANAEPRHWHEASLRTRWIPDAFAGPMASLMEAIETGGEPETSGRTTSGRCASLRRVSICRRGTWYHAGRRWLWDESKTGYQLSIYGRRLLSAADLRLLSCRLPTHRTGGLIPRPRPAMMGRRGKPGPEVARTGGDKGDPEAGRAYDSNELHAYRCDDDVARFPFVIG